MSDERRRVGTKHGALAGHRCHDSVPAGTFEVACDRHVHLVGTWIVTLDGDIGTPPDVPDEDRAQIEGAQRESRFVTAAELPQLVREVCLGDDARGNGPVPGGHSPGRLTHVMDGT